MHQELMDTQVIGPRGEVTSIIWPNGHGFKPTPKDLSDYTHR